MAKRRSRRGAQRGIHRQTRPHKVLGRLRHILPVLLRLKLVIPCNDRLHLLLLRVAIERRVPSEEEVGNDTHSPDVNGFTMPDYKNE